MTTLHLWCPTCSRRQPFEPAGTSYELTGIRRQFLRCTDCAGTWKYLSRADGRRLEEDWEPCGPRVAASDAPPAEGLGAREPGAGAAGSGERRGRF